VVGAPSHQYCFGFVTTATIAAVILLCLIVVVGMVVQGGQGV
jgi:hypothetical protein